MGKIRTRVLGLTQVEQEQKKEQKRKAEEKAHKKIRAQGLKGGERMIQVDVSEEAVKKMEKAKEIIISKVQEKKKTASIKKTQRVRGQKYQEVKKKINRDKKYGLEEAVSFLKKNNYCKFDQSIELHFNVDRTGLKGEVKFPHSIGKSVRIKIVDNKVIDDIGKGNLDFDILVTSPSYMPKLAKFAKILGPKGLMPNPKAGTISTNPQEVAKKLSTGSLRWKTEAKFPLIHQIIGKISFEDSALVENACALINSVGKNHIRNVFIKSTMSPSLKVDIEKI